MSPIVRRQIIAVLIFLVVVALFVTTFRMGVVRGLSMYPTYDEGQVVLVRRRSWGKTPLRRDDVILLRKGRDVLIKRVHRLAGEEITDPELLFLSARNGLADYYEQESATSPDGRTRTRLFVPEGYLVVLGDNRRASEDSRMFGPIPERDVLGVVVAAPPPPLPDELESALLAPRLP